MKVVKQAQYKAALTVTECLREKLYEKLGWELLQIEGGFTGFPFFIRSKMFNHIPAQNQAHYLRSRSSNILPTTRTQRYQTAYFPYCIKQWNNLDTFVSSLSSAHLEII